MTEPLVPTLYTRHQRPLRAVLLELQVWFSAQDLGRLMGRQLDERQMRKLDPDQYRISRFAAGMTSRTHSSSANPAPTHCWSITTPRKIVQCVSG